MKFTVTANKPRNPLVVLARQRRAGRHQRSQSGQRQAQRQAVQQALRDHHAHSP